MDEEKLQRGLSTIARFVRAPHTLPASMVNTLKMSMVGGDQPAIASEKYVLAQLGSQTYPVTDPPPHLDFAVC